MFEILKSGPFVAGLTIIVSAGFGVFVRVVSRNDRYRSWVAGDFAVGLEILIALLALLASKSVEYLIAAKEAISDDFSKAQLNERILVCVYGLLGVLITIWIVSTVIRKRGWTESNESNLFWGVIMPNQLSIYFMFFFFNLFNFLLK